MIGSEAGIDAQHRHQAADHEHSCDQQHHRKAHLSDDQHGAHSSGMSLVRCRLLQHGVHVGLGDVNRWYQRERNSCERANRHGEQQDGEAEVYLLRTLQVGRLQRQEHANAKVTDSNGQQAAKEAEQQSFDDHLYNETRPTGAQCLAYGELLLSRYRSGQHQVRQIGAGQQEDQSDRAPTAPVGFAAVPYLRLPHRPEKR